MNEQLPAITKEQKKAQKQAEKEELRRLRKEEREAIKAANEKRKEEIKQAQREMYLKSLPVSNFEEWTKEGYPKCTIGNVRIMLNSLGITVRHNVIKKDTEIVIPNYEFLQETERDSKINQLISFAVSCDMAYHNVKHFVHTIASQNPRNPVADWILSKEWDGVSRLPDLYATVTAANEDTSEGKLLKETLIRKWLISAVAAAFTDRGIKAQGMLVFQGEQGLGKSSWFSSLAPKDMDVIKCEASVDPRNKDSVLQTVSYWLVELGELDATFKRSEISALKAFVTSDVDVLRKSYGHAACNMPRRTVFFASVNKEDFLVDETGNRRFWTVPVIKLDPFFKFDIQQLWREVYDTMYLKKESYILSREELVKLNISNEAFESVDPLEDFISDYYEIGTDGDLVTPAEIAKLYGYQTPGKKETGAIGRAIVKIFKTKRLKMNGKRGYMLRRKDGYDSNETKEAEY